MFQRLQELPLFQGLNMTDMNEIVSKVRMDFQQFSEEETLALQGAHCRQLIFVLKGSVRVEYVDAENRFRFIEYLNPPLLIEPQNLFGMWQKYKRSYLCETPCQTLTIERSQFLSIMMNFPIVKANMLNHICNLLQHSQKNLENISHKDADIKFRQFVRNMSLTPLGKKHLYSTMETLSDIFCETRLNVSKVLKNLKEQELITQERKAYTILDITKL